MTNAASNGRTHGAGALDLAVAGLAAIAVAFVTFAMPDDIFSRLISQSGLPSFIAAAEPPLGMKARMAVIGVGAVLTFAAIWMLLRALDRIPTRRARAESPAAGNEPAFVPEAPRLRRADAHPDAPPRRPLLAGRDLGEPAAPEEPGDKEERFADLVASPLPGFPAPEAEDVPEISEEQDTLELTEPVPITTEILDSRLPANPEESGERSITDLMRRLEHGLSERREPATPSQASPPEIVAPEQKIPAAEAPERFEAEHAPAPESVAEQAPEPEPVAETPAEPEPVEEVRVGHRLRSAINDLQKVAGRAG
jgi:hypothetical protein